MHTHRHCREIMTAALPNKLHSGHHKATEDKDKRPGVRNGDNKIQLQLEEDGSGSSRQKWAEKNVLWV